MSNAQPKLILFLAFANDRQNDVQYLRNLPEEARRLQEALDTAIRANLCEVIVRQNVTAPEVFNVFQDDRVRGRIALFHFGGHANGYQLLLESAAGAAEAADAGGLAAFLGEQNGLCLVFLNGCSTQRQVQGLLDVGVDAVIATAQAINDAVATDFAARFYRGLASGSTVESAFKQAAGTIQTQHGEDLRHLYLGNKNDETEAAASLLADRLPWDITYREGAEQIAGWNLPDAANDPLAALPALPAMDLPDSPFRYLRWFRREDAPIFFGRGYQIRDLYSRVTDKTGAPIILFYGQSGVGKSSLLAAGLLPRLEESHEVIYLRRDQTTGLLGTLALALQVPSHLKEGVDYGGLWAQREENLNRPLVIIIDQVEEVYTRPSLDNPTELVDFLAALSTVFADRANRPQGKLILGFRKEWLAEIEKQLAERSLARSKVFLQRLDRRNIIEAITSIARNDRLQTHFGLTLSSHLPTEIADDLLADRGSAIAPTLQILLSKLWERAKSYNYDNPCFDEELYHELRQEGLGLSDFLDNQLATLHKQYPKVVDSGLALDLLAFHITRLGTAGECSLADLRKSYSHHEAALPTVLSDFQNLYLLVESAQNQPDAEPRSRLAHDTLARLVALRYEESDLPGQRARRVLENRALDWCNGQTGNALDEADLALVEAGTTGMRVLSTDEQRLVDASVAQRLKRSEERERLAREREEAQQRELALQKKVNLWLRTVVGILATAVIVLFWLFALPVLQKYLTSSSTQFIEAGTAIIGTNASEADESEKPQLLVELDGFYMEQFEVTNSQYQRCVDARQCSLTSTPAKLADPELRNHPVVNVNAYQAAEYCGWLGRRLPTELEWEFAARGPEGRDWPWGTDKPIDLNINMLMADRSIGQTTPVNETRDDVTPDKIYNLAGNVSEWTSSYALDISYDEYDTSKHWDGLAYSISDESYLVNRGGSWSNQVTKIYSRGFSPVGFSFPTLGFRCVKQHDKNQ